MFVCEIHACECCRCATGSVLYYGPTVAPHSDSVAPLLSSHEHKVDDDNGDGDEDGNDGSPVREVKKHTNGGPADFGIVPYMAAAG